MKAEVFIQEMIQREREKLDRLRTLKKALKGMEFDPDRAYQEGFNRIDAMDKQTIIRRYVSADDARLYFLTSGE